MARTVGAALRPVDGNTAAQSSHVDHCAHGQPAATAAACAAPAGGAPAAAAAAAAAAPPSADYVAAATQDAVADQLTSDHMKHLHLSPSGSAAPPAQESPAFTVHTDSVRSLPPANASEDGGATAALQVDEFLTTRLLYVPSASADAVSDDPMGTFRPCEQRLAPCSPASAASRADGGCDIDASIPACGAQDVTAGRVLIGLQLCNSHASASYSVRFCVDGGPSECVTVAPGETVLSTAPRSGGGSVQPFEARVHGGGGAAPMSPRSASVPTDDSVRVVFTRSDPLGIVFDECEDARDGERYLVVNSVHPGTQAAELRERTADASACSDAALIRPGMVVQKLSGGDVESEVHVSSLYREHGQVPPQIFAMRPLGLVLSARDHGTQHSQPPLSLVATQKPEDRAN